MGYPALKEPPSRMTLDEFLAWNDGTDTRYELIDGEVFAMAPPSSAHGTVVANLTIAIGSRLRRPCRMISEAGILLSARKDAYVQADMMITCAPPAVGERIAPAPLVVLEVLSPSTAAHDRGTKLPEYRALPSVQEIVLVSSTEMRAEVWHRTAEGWVVDDLGGGDAVLHLRSLDAEVPLGPVYEGVALATETTERTA